MTAKQRAWGLGFRVPYSSEQGFRGISQYDDHKEREGMRKLLYDVYGAAKPKSVNAKNTDALRNPGFRV